jgi:hypothetical protein
MVCRRVACNLPTLLRLRLGTDKYIGPVIGAHSMSQYSGAVIPMLRHNATGNLTEIDREFESLVAQ